MSSFDSPQAAEAAFYAAFERCDPDAMMAVWAAHDEVLCVHPMGPALRGREAVARSWRQIFEHAGALRFSLSGLLERSDDAVSVRFVEESIRHGADFSGLSIVLATNVYRREPGGWRMVLHHASPGGTARDTQPGAVPGVVH